MSFLAVFRSRRMAVLFLLGFSSGLPLLLTGQTLQAWLTSEGVSVADIAAFSLVGLAYTFKWAWAPMLDRLRWPFLGRRRGWAVVTQIGLLVAIVSMGFVDPARHPGTLAVFAVIVATLSASQDVVLDAYNADLLAPDERAAGVAIYVIGYRVAMLVTGLFAFYLADFVPWSVIYSVIGSLMLVGVVATMLAEEPDAPAHRTTTLEALYLPFVALYRRFGVRGSLAIVAFAALYKFGDSFVQTLQTTFFRRGLGFAWSEIATGFKIAGFAGVFVGGMFAGPLTKRFGIPKMLVVFGILQAATNLLYALLADVGHSYVMFGAAVLVDYITGAMGTAVFLGFFMSVCSKEVSATQFALLTSMSSVGQRVFGPFAADVVNRFDGHAFQQLVATHATIEEAVRPYVHDAVTGFSWSRLPDIAVLQGKLEHALLPRGTDVLVSQAWPYFFIATAVMAIPGLVLAVYVGRLSGREVAPPAQPS